MSWLVMRAFFGGVVQKLVQWLSHRSFYQLVCMALAALLIVQHFELIHTRKNDAAHVKQRDAYKAQLDAISSNKNTQQIVTREKIKLVTQHIHDADGKAKVIEQAPLPGNCRSPRQVLDADI